MRRNEVSVENATRYFQSKTSIACSFHFSLKKKSIVRSTIFVRYLTIFEMNSNTVISIRKLKEGGKKDCKHNEKTTATTRKNYNNNREKKLSSLALYNTHR